jgi:1,4-alpha-glucan branching enzyme
MMRFVLALHSHLPYVLNHGRWPHGSDWLTEAAVDTYLPLLQTLRDLEREGVDAPITLGVTPVLANQLASPTFVTELEAFLAQRLQTCAEAPAALAATNDEHLLPIARYWEQRYRDLLALFREVNGDLVTALRGFAERGRLELISSCATHGFLPLLGRDESIRLQLLTGRAEHRRLFGMDPAGCWLPECAFRPAGRWAPPGATPVENRRGTDEHLRDAGYAFFFVDAHLVQAGGYLGQYHEVTLGMERFGTDHLSHVQEPDPQAKRSPYFPYRMPVGNGRPLHALVRDPKTSLQIWSRFQGYPGDVNYLEFHKIRWPGGLKLWRVTSGDADLGDKLPYDPQVARARAREHARHFAGVLAGVASSEPGTVIVAPFDTELYGHWWFEGVDFLGDLYRHLKDSPAVPARGSDVLSRKEPRPVVRLIEGSWGNHGDFSMWIGPETEWTWHRLWPLEDQFWRLARAALAGGDDRRAVLAQAARSMLIAQASDWQFIISTGAAADYAGHRLLLHVEDAETLLKGLEPGASAAAFATAVAEAERLRARDDLFPDVLTTIEQSLA